METYSLRDYYFIINPAAGKGTAQKELIRQIRATLPAGSYHLYATSGVGNGERYVDTLATQAVAEL